MTGPMRRAGVRAAALALAVGVAGGEVMAQAKPGPSATTAKPAPAVQAPSAPQAPSRLLPDSEAERRTTALAATLRCPVCQGLSIQDSPSELAQQMRTLMKEQIAAGKSDDEVRDYFLSKYGEFILLEPRARGFNLLAYLLPAFILVGGALLITRNVKKWTAPAAAGDAPAPADADDDPPTG